MPVCACGMDEGVQARPADDLCRKLLGGSVVGTGCTSSPSLALVVSWHALRMRLRVPRHQTRTFTVRGSKLTRVPPQHLPSCQKAYTSLRSFGLTTGSGVKLPAKLTKARRMQPSRPRRLCLCSLRLQMIVSLQANPPLIPTIPRRLAPVQVRVLASSVWD